MARISTYDLDGTISNTDKVIGTDSSNTTTKNFKLQSLKEFIFSGISGPVTINSSGVSSVTFPDVTLGTDTSGSYVESLVAGDGIQLLNNSGEGATPTIKVNPLQTTITSILNTGLCVGRDSTDKICFTTDNQIRFTVNNALDLILKENALTPGTSDGTALGADDSMWSDLFLANESVINFNNGNVTLTHGSGFLRINTDSKLEFGDTGTFIHQSANGILDLVSDDELELNATNEVEINTTLVDVNASGAITLNAEANSNITITGELDIDSSSALTIDSATSISIGTHQDKPVDIDASTLQIDASGGFSIDSGAVSSNMTVATGGGDAKDLTISVTGGGDSSLVLTSTGTGTDALDINSSGGIDIDSTGGVTVDAGGNSNITVTGSLDVDASSNITIDGTGVSIDGTLDSNFTVDGSGQDLALKAIGGGAQVLSLDSAGTGTNAIDINATGGGVDIVAAANVSMLAATSFVAQGNTSAKFGDDTEQITYDGSGNLDIDAVTIDLDSSGAINILADGDASDIIIKTNHVAGPAFHLDANSNVGSIVDIDAGILYIASDGLTSMLSDSTFDIDAVGAVTIDGSAITIGADDSGVAISIGHTTSETTVNDNLTVTGTLKANGLTYPANVNDANINEVLTKTSNGTIGFSTPASVGVSANTDDSDRTVVFANGNVLHDDNDTVSSSSFKYNPNDKILTVNNIVPKTSDDGSLGTSALSYSDLFLANGGIIEFKAGTGNRSQITHIDGSSGNDGSLRLSAKTKLEFNDAQVSIASLDDGHLDLVADTEVQIVSPIVNIDASTRVDISGALIVGGTLTLDSVGVSAIQTSGESFVDNNTSLMTSAAIDDRINSSQSMGSGFVLEDDSGDEVTVTESKEVKFIGSGGLTINWTDTDNGTDGDPYDLTFTIGTLNQDTTGTSDKVTVTDSTGTDTSFPLVFHNESNGLLDHANGFEYNPNKTKLCLGFDTNTTDVDISRNLISAKNGNHFFELRDTSTNGGTLLLGQVSSSGNYNCIFSREKDNGATNAYEFRIIQSSGGSNVNSLIIGTDHAATFINSVTATAFAAKSNTNSKGAVINLSTTDTVIIANDILGTIEFQAPDEDNGNDAAIIAAEIRAVAEETFDNTSNDTKFEFITSRGTAITSSTAPVATISSIGQFVLNTPASGLLQTRSIKSVSTNTSGHYFEINSTQSGGTGGSLVIGVAGGANRIFSYDNTGSASSTRKFEIVTNGSDSANFIFDTDGDLEAGSYSTSSDKRLKSEIEPIKEGLEVIKQFSSYTYIKSGKKESGFIAQEVKEVIPHAVHENDEGYLSMSDRGVLAHMHKAILELDKRLQAIEDKIKN